MDCCSNKVQPGSEHTFGVSPELYCCVAMMKLERFFNAVFYVGRYAKITVLPKFCCSLGQEGYRGVFWCSKMQPFVWGENIDKKMALIPWLGFQFNPSLIRGEEDGFLCQA